LHILASTGAAIAGLSLSSLVPSDYPTAGHYQSDRK
jgi:hypothetical protein